MSISSFMLSDGEPRTLPRAGCVSKGLSDAFFFDIGVCSKNLSRGTRGSDDPDNHAHCHTHSAHAGLAPITTEFLEPSP
jgi:hypothetical protein